jgi:hypothetical protein
MCVSLCPGTEVARWRGVGDGEVDSNSFPPNSEIKASLRPPHGTTPGASIGEQRCGEEVGNPLYNARGYMDNMGPHILFAVIAVLMFIDACVTMRRCGIMNVGGGT